MTWMLFMKLVAASEPSYIQIEWIRVPTPAPTNYLCRLPVSSSPFFIITPRSLKKQWSCLQIDLMEHSSGSSRLMICLPVHRGSGFKMAGLGRPIC